MANLERISGAYEWIRYEVDRVRRLGPTAFRLGLSQLEDRVKAYVEALKRRRSAAEHVSQAASHRRKRRLRKPNRNRPLA